ncbi:MAG: hypothetical protein O3A51_08935, partial [Verrucomicrobia bacterium]|nr:hypothetical protein [Verrucomicrobiota bacterium]
MHRTLMVILLVAMPITCSAGKASAPWNATWTCSFMDEICTQQADSSILPNYPDWQPHKAKCPLSPEKASTAAHAELK